MSPNANITSTTNQYLAPAFVDQVLRDNLFFGKILENTEKWSGAQMLFPVKYQKGIASVPFNGFDVLPINQVPTTVNMFFYPTFVATNIALAGTDLSVNKAEGNGSLKTLDLMKVTMESRAQDAADDIGNYFQADGTGTSGKAPMGLAGIVDNGSTLATYGGLSRATYTGLNATVTASGGTISLLKVRTLWNAIADGPIRPDMILTDYTTWSYFEQLLTPFQRNTMTQADLKSDHSSASGYADLFWDGLKIFRDKKVLAGNFYLLNLDYLKFYGLNYWEGTKVSPKAQDIEGNVYEDSIYSPGNAFTWTGWIRPYNMASVNGFIILGGQLICTNPFRQGVLTGVLGI
jgi:hypothetical protein